MDGTRIVRYTLWASLPFNLGAAYILAFPSSMFGRLAGFPESVPLMYAALLSFLVCLFGVVCAWLAVQPRIDRPLVAVAAIGKTGVFLIAIALWLTSNASGRIVLIACGDLAFAIVWFWWLVSPRGEADDA